MSQHETLKTSWVYSLKKEELVTYLVQCGQEPSGTVDELRKRLAKIITADPNESLVGKLLEWQRQHDTGLNCSPSITGRVSSGKSELMKPESAKLVVPTMPPSVTLEAGSGDSSTLAAREDRIATIELMRKWGVKYDGGKDVLKFVVRLEELATMYEVDLNTVVPMMCELLKDRALIWFRNNRKPWEQWSWFKKDLLDFFLPQRYLEKSESEIRSRTPPTPGRGWLDRLDELDNARNTVQYEATTTPATSRPTSPIPLPPPVNPFHHTQTPTPTPVPESLQFEDLPIDIQREINLPKQTCQVYSFDIWPPVSCKHHGGRHITRQESVNHSGGGK